MRLYSFILYFLLFSTSSISQTSHQLSSSLSSSIKATIDSLNPVGLSMAIIHEGNIVYKKAFGHKHLPSNRPLNTSSLFNIASCSKAFTAASIARLVENGQLSWDDKVTDYISNFRLSDPCITQQMTLTDLLTHRSGLATFDGDLLWYNTDYSNEQIIQRLRHLPIKRQFRSKFGYQNNMYMIAGQIIEKVTGQSWSDYVDQHFFSPLQMTASRPSNTTLSTGQDTAYPHIYRKVQKLYPFRATKPAGAIYSNVEELVHWSKMLMNQGVWEGDTILKPSTVQQLFTPQTILSVSDERHRMGVNFMHYGLGWFLYDYAGAKIAEHNGGMPGYISKVCLVPEQGLGLIILNNGQHPFVNDALRNLVLSHYLKDTTREDWISYYAQQQRQLIKKRKKQREQRKAKRVKNTEPSRELASYTGRYRDPYYGEANVTMEDGQLKVSLLPAASVFTGVMSHWHYDTFRVKFKDAFLPFGLVTFHLDAGGAVNHFTIDLPSGDFHFQNLNFRKISE